MGGHGELRLIITGKQLIQTGNQQSSMLNLLQKFIGNSQSGINSMETRVNGLGMVLDEISFDWAISSGRVSNSDFAGNTCCKLLRAEFLSSKFWKRTQGHTTSRLFSTGSNQALITLNTMPNKYVSNKMQISFAHHCASLATKFRRWLACLGIWTCLEFLLKQKSVA